ncbi:hypothetical protein FRC17_006232 [Serendipita sp. 399]|nr:hypothetical protein FRC17_006232 [Serendipita sp. 399]
MLVDKVSTADAIAVPRLKMSLEMDQQEYRHAPILNLMTRGMEEGRTVIFGREVELGSEDILDEVIVACLERLPETSWAEHYHKDWEYYWDIIVAMELNSGGQAIRRGISIIQNGYHLEALTDIVVANTRVTPISTKIDEGAMRKLKKNEWDRSALTNVMKDVDPLAKRFFKVYAIVRKTAFSFHWVIHPVSRKWIEGGTWDDHLLGNIILRMWDYELWRPLPDDVQWGAVQENGEWCVCRMRRFRAKPEYEGDGWVRLKVDENGEVVDTPGNQDLYKWIQEDPRSRLSKFLRKLNV